MDFGHLGEDKERRSTAQGNFAKSPPRGARIEMSLRSVISARAHQIAPRGA
ncbi:hypothetical protein HMPREF0262_00995 [Clostridium sp. ATCC 29733]|nr:hypothetical protein HMPREF0262_00995 [Clostridium sp. ATCC 29733]